MPARWRPQSRARSPRAATRSWATGPGSTGVVQTGGGNSSEDSVGVVQIGSLVASPDATVQSDELGTAASAGGGSGVNSGDNSADPSAGVVQVGGVYSAPTASASSDG